MTNAANELEKLRDILYGEQMREIRERLTALETNLHAINEQINGKIEALDSESQQKLSQQSAEMQRLAAEQSQKIKQESQSLVGQIEALRKQVKKEAEQSQQRDQALKDELHELLAKLEASTISRAELGQALMELGKSVQHAK
ncbi:MAG: hypothetical protein ACUVRJ_11030 [Candidatus Villigracilaceae bacterium]